MRLSGTTLRTVRAMQDPAASAAILALMVRTGDRVHALKTLLRQLGHREAVKKPPSPRLTSLPPSTASQVMDLYLALGGIHARPRLAPGSWDIAYETGLLLELDEDLHFNRYRAVTLDAPWAAELPWTSPYRGYMATGERRAGTGGKRWTTPSSEMLFGRADPDGVLGEHGAPRWKQRALYDAMKDAAAATGQSKLARVSIYDGVEGHLLNDVLYGRVTVDPHSVAELIERRTV